MAGAKRGNGGRFSDTRGRGGFRGRGGRGSFGVNRGAVGGGFRGTRGAAFRGGLNRGRGSRFSDAFPSKEERLAKLRSVPICKTCSE